MVPDTAAALGVFLLLVAPGLVYQLLRAGSRPESERSAFREASVVALTSLLFSGAAVALLAVARAISPGLLPDPGLWLQQGSEYLHDHYRLVARGVLVELAFALVLAFAVHRWLDLATTNAYWRRVTATVLGEGRRLEAVSIWFRLFHVDYRKGEHVFVTVETIGGDVYTGYVVAYTVDDKTPADRELVLGPPLMLRRDGDELPLAPWQRLVLPGSQVASVLVSYVTESAAQRAKPAVISP
jgi:hypothetical protein